MVNDAGNQWAGSATLAGPGSEVQGSAPLSNGQCSLDVSRSSALVSADGTFVQLNLQLTFKAAYVGDHPWNLQVQDNSIPNLFSDWQPIGHWQVTAGAGQNVSIGTSPAGRTFLVDAITYSASQSFLWTVGDSHALSTSSPQSGIPGTRYVFNAWSDGGSLSHSVLVPASATNYTASFDTQYQLTAAPNPSAAGTISPNSGFFNANSAVSVTATPGACFVFGSWGPGVPGGIVPMSARQTVTVNFVPSIATVIQ